MLIKKYATLNDKNSLNILQMYDYMLLGGAESHIVTLSNEFKNLGHNVFIASPVGAGIELINKYKLIHLKCNLNDSMLINDSIEEIAKIIEEYNIDIIHTHPCNSQVVGATCSEKTNIPVITTLHSVYITPSIKELYSSTFKKYICVSEEVKEKQILHGCNKEKISIINNSVPIKNTPNVNSFFRDGCITICYISRLDDDKLQSLLNLLSAIPALRQSMNTKLYIVGYGTQFENVKNLSMSINSKFNEDVVIMVGSTADVEQYIDKSDIVVGVGRVILEGIASGKFAICVGNQFFPGLIDSEKLVEISKVNFTDRNCNTEFTIDNFVKQINKIYNDFGFEFNELCHTYDTLCKNYSIIISAKKHIAIYKEVIDSNQYIPYP